MSGAGIDAAGGLGVSAADAAGSVPTASATSFRVLMKRRAVASLVAARTLAGDNVQTSRDVEVNVAQLPILLVYTSSESKVSESAAGSSPLFLATCKLHVLARIAEATPAAAEDTLDLLVDQVQDALMTSPAFLMPPLRDCSAISVSMLLDGKSKSVIGDAAIVFDLRYFDVFQPVVPDTLRTIAINVDAGSPFDATGSYDPAHPAPRTHGPDGRVEIAATIPNLQS